MNTTAPAIDVSHLVTHYGSRKILDDISVQARQGEIMVIMGGSGSGKSTLLRHLLGLHRPTSGSIKLLGKDITQLSADEMYDLRKNMGVAFQGGALFNSMSVGENVELPLREHTQLDDNTIRIMSRMKLEVVNLAGFENLMPSELSGGMIKRAALARALALDPEVLFLDEPTAGLDPIAAAAFDQLTLTLRDALGLSVFLVTHDLDTLYSICDRVAVLAHKHVLITDKPEVVADADDPWIREYFHGPRGRAAQRAAEKLKEEC